MQKSKWLGVGMAALLLLAAVYLMLRPAPKTVAWVQPSQGDLVVSVVNTRAGTIKSCQRAGLSLPGGGVVQSIAVSAGDRVSQGQRLLTLWSEDLQAELASAEASAALNQVLREQSCIEVEFKAREARRLLTLRARNLTSQTLSEQAESIAAHSRLACEAASAQAKVDAARSAAIRARLSKTELHAPFAGVIAEVNSKPGEYMTPSPPGIAMPPVIDLIDDSCLYVSAPIDEIDAARLKVGQPAIIRLDALPGQGFPARVRRIAPYVKELEKQARTVEVEADFTPRPTALALLVGYSADLEVEVARHNTVWRLPAEARREDGKVLRLDGDRLTLISPHFGLENWNWVEVKEGIAPQDKLVLHPGQLTLTPELRVKGEPRQEAP